MTKDVIVRVRGVQFIPDTEDSEEPIEIVTPGVYEYADGVHRIVYEETFEGFENEPTVNTVTITDDSIIVQKVGAITVDMVFEPGKMSVSPYETPFGAIEMGFLTNRLLMERTEEKIHILSEYTLAMNGENAADCVLEMTIENKM
jgi:uncharacterized beta-barrel protein YwiB (DUF1934 family)